LNQPTSTCSSPLVKFAAARDLYATPPAPVCTGCGGREPEWRVSGWVPDLSIEGWGG
jgi:hypothetical protein